MIQFFNVSINYDGKSVLDKVTLEIKAGEFAYLIGASGAGKTTLLRIIYLDEFPMHGHIVLGEFDSFQITKKLIPAIRRKIGVVFQDFKLLPDRNVFDNVAFPALVTGVRNREIKRRTIRVLSEVGLSHKRSQYPGKLSGGEQQRVAIARALVNEPMILLADEPTGNLDPETAYDIVSLLKKINRKGTAVFIATHNYNIVNEIPGKVFRLENGNLYKGLE